VVIAARATRPLQGNRTPTAPAAGAHPRHPGGVHPDGSSVQAARHLEGGGVMTTHPTGNCLSPVAEHWKVPGDPALCPEIRRRTRTALAGFPSLVDDAELVVSELFGNACRHTRSGDGGTVTVNVSALRTGLVVLSVTDDGPKRDPVTGRPLRPRVQPFDSRMPCHRGLRIVMAVTDDWGSWTTDDGGHTVWAMFTPPGGAPAEPLP
jgi:anti-sigma regulatory factor (Ser/Thr protein kinase)